MSCLFSSIFTKIPTDEILVQKIFFDEYLEYFKFDCFALLIKSLSVYSKGIRVALKSVASQFISSSSIVLSNEKTKNGNMWPVRDPPLYSTTEWYAKQGQ